MPRKYDRRVRVLVAVATLSLPACVDDGSAAPADLTAQATPARPAPAPAASDQPVNPDARALAGFLQGVNQYVALHQRRENSLTPLSKESSPQAIDTHQRALGQMIQQERRNAKPGDIFTPESQAVIKRLLTKVFGGPDGPALKASIMDENPGVPDLKVNQRYPDTVPLSTIPPQVLQGLPRLPEEMEFRFIGNTLILMDVHAHIIADLIPNAFPR
jgi:hypothetical protein